MAEILFTNFATSTIADVGGIASGDLTVSVQAGDGALFPNPSDGDYFLLVLVDTSGNREIVKCTGRSTDTLTIVRAQEGTSARAFAEDDKVELRVTKGTLEAMVQGPSGPTENNILTFDADGNAQDSGVAVSSLITNVTTSPSGSSSVSVVVTPGNLYRVDFSLVLSSGSANLNLRVNSDTGSNYGYANHYGGVSSTDVHDIANSATATAIQLTTQAMEQLIGQILFSTLPGDNTVALIKASIGGKDLDGTSYMVNMDTVGYYDGPSAISAFSIYPSAGTFTGKIIAEAIG